ncbi:unnamed protein product, partial [Mesorhabditis belari]|uniref:Uncharacterized protein n=1 Tax=Mesorhabditis belari TaxID=2138241 RepID=A0AAF3EUT5_9BILA
MSIAFEASFLSTTAEIDPFLSLYSNKAYVDAMVKQMGNQVGSATITKAFIQWGNGEWDVTNVSTLNIVEAGMEVTFYLLNIRRVPNFYVYVIALPCFILTALSVVGMFWTRNIKKEQLVKLSIGLTSLVSMTVLLEMLSDSIPKTSVFPLLGIYVVCSISTIRKDQLPIPLSTQCYQLSIEPSPNQVLLFEKLLSVSTAMLI